MPFSLLLQVWHLQPWFSKDFVIRPLADRLHDLEQLQFLYPDLPKGRAFGEFYSQEPATPTGADYVRTDIAAVIPAQQQQLLRGSAAPSPQPAAGLGAAGGGYGGGVVRPAATAAAATAAAAMVGLSPASEHGDTPGSPAPGPFPARGGFAAGEPAMVELTHEDVAVLAHLGLDAAA